MTIKIKDAETEKMLMAIGHIEGLTTNTSIVKFLVKFYSRKRKEEIDSYKATTG